MVFPDCGALQQGRRVTCDSNLGSLATQGHLRLVGVTYDSKLGSLVPNGFLKGNTKTNRFRYWMFVSCPFSCTGIEASTFLPVPATASADSDCFILIAMLCSVCFMSGVCRIASAPADSHDLSSKHVFWLRPCGSGPSEGRSPQSQCIIIYKLKWPTRFSTWCCVIICIGTAVNSSSVQELQTLYFSFMYLYTILFHLAFWGPTKKRWCWKITGRKLALTVLGFMTKA